MKNEFGVFIWILFSEVFVISVLILLILIFCFFVSVFIVFDLYKLKYLFFAESNSFINKVFFFKLLLSFDSEIKLKKGYWWFCFELISIFVFVLEFELFDKETTFLFVVLFFLLEENGLNWILILSFASVFNMRWILLLIISILSLYLLPISIICFLKLLDDIESFFDSFLFKLIFSVWIISFEFESNKLSSFVDIIWLFAV